MKNVKIKMNEKKIENVKLGEDGEWKQMIGK